MSANLNYLGAMQNQELSPLQPVHNLKPYKRVEGTHQIERFFRLAAEIDVDKEDLRRYYNFIDMNVVLRDNGGTTQDKDSTVSANNARSFPRCGRGRRSFQE